MKQHSPSNWKESLLNSIDKLQENKKAFFEKPETAFSRTQKISLWDTILFPMIADNETGELEDTMRMCGAHGIGEISKDMLRI